MGPRPKLNFFENMVMLQIKFKLATLAATWLQIFCPQTHSRPRGWGQKVKLSFSESSHVAYQIKADEAGSNMVAIFCPQIHSRPRGWDQKVKLYLFLNVAMLHIKLKGIEHRAP